MTMTTTTDVIAIEKDHLLQVYRRNQVVFDRGRGCRLFDTNGRSYLDLISGVGVAALGHAHPRLAARSGGAGAGTAAYVEPVLPPAPGGARRAPVDALGTAARVLLQQRRRSGRGEPEVRPPLLALAGRHDRTEYVALQDSFHGRTMGALSVTWDDHYRAPFAPLVPGVTFVAADDAAALSAAVTDRTAAVIVEPIQGEGGVRPIRRRWPMRSRDACSRTGALLIADEVQCGLGRTGRPFYSAALGLRPDIMAIGKSLGAGVPIAAALFTDRVAARRLRSAITAAPTAATCWHAGVRWCSSTSSWTAD